MAKIASGILVLRQGKATSWTSDVDTNFQSWITKYIGWLTTANIAIQEKDATKYVHFPRLEMFANLLDYLQQPRFLLLQPARRTAGSRQQQHRRSIAGCSTRPEFPVDREGVSVFRERDEAG